MQLCKKGKINGEGGRLDDLTCYNMPILILDVHPTVPSKPAGPPGNVQDRSALPFLLYMLSLLYSLWPRVLISATIVDDN